MKCNVAVVGTGYWGKNLVRNYAAMGCLRLVCDSNPQILQNFLQEYPGIEVTSAFIEVLHCSDVEAVVIASPSETHFTLAKEALTAGKHVYVEKPLALDPIQAQELVDLAESCNRILMVGHLLQYHPAFVCLKELVKGGELGRINYIYSHRLNLGKIRREENSLWSFAPHDISMILALANEMPDAVFATGGSYLHSRLADVTVTHLAFPSGLRAHIFVSWLHPFKEHKLVVVGDRKMAVFDDTLPWTEKLVLYPHEIHWRDGVPVPVKAEGERVAVREAEPLREECLHFLRCVNDGSKPLTDGLEGLRVVQVLKAAQYSMDNNAKAVHIQHLAKSDTPSQFFVHPTAVIDQDVTIGQGSKIWHFSHILSRTIVGANCNIGQNVVVGPDVIIGQGCKIQNNVSVYKGVTLEDFVFCGPSMVFTNIYNPRAAIRKMDQLRPTLVRTGATLGANCTIICGVTIGRYAFVGAGAVVTHNVPDHALVVGNPARQIGWVCECGEKLSIDLVCPLCGLRYQKIPNADGLIRLPG